MNTESKATRRVMGWSCFLVLALSFFLLQACDDGTNDVKDADADTQIDPRPEDTGVDRDIQPETEVDALDDADVQPDPVDDQDVVEAEEDAVEGDAVPDQPLDPDVIDMEIQDGEADGIIVDIPTEADLDMPRDPDVEADLDAPRDPDVEADLDAPRDPDAEAELDTPRDPDAEAELDIPRDPDAGDDVEAPTVNVYFSEYIEGSSNNKAVEIYNGGTQALDLTTCSVKIYNNGHSSPDNSITLQTTLQPGGVHVLCHGSFVDPPRTTVCNQLASTLLNFNGNDAVTLVCSDTTYDVIGQIGNDPGVDGWGTGDVTTTNHTLRRKGTVTHGDPNGADAFDPAVEWNGFQSDTFDGLGTR